MKKLTKKIIYLSTAMLLLTSFSKDNAQEENSGSKISEEILIDQSLKYEMAVDNLDLILNHRTESSTLMEKRDEPTVSLIPTNRKSGTKNRIYQGSIYRMYALN